MKKHASLTILTTLCAILLSACGNNEAFRSIHSISVDSQPSKGGRILYEDNAMGAMSIIGAFSLVGQVASLGANAAVSSGPRRAIDQAAQSHSIAVEKIVADAFSAEIQRRGNFTPANPGTGDATFKLTVKYGLGQEDHRSFAPVVQVRPELVKDGEEIYSVRGAYAGGRADKEHWHRFEEFKSNPELLRIGWQSAAHRINTECEKLIEHWIQRSQVEMAAAQQIPIKCFQMAKIENDSMPLGNGTIVKRFGTHDLEQLVGTGARRSQPLYERRRSYLRRCSFHGVPPIIRCDQADYDSRGT